MSSEACRLFSDWSKPLSCSSNLRALLLVSGREGRGSHDRSACRKREKEKDKIEGKEKMVTDKGTCRYGKPRTHAHTNRHIHMGRGGEQIGYGDGTVRAFPLLH